MAAENSAVVLPRTVSENFCTVAIGQEGFSSIRRPSLVLHYGKQLAKFFIQEALKRANQQLIEPTSPRRTSRLSRETRR